MDQVFKMLTVKLQRPLFKSSLFHVPVTALLSLSSTAKKCPKIFRNVQNTFQIPPTLFVTGINVTDDIKIYIIKKSMALPVII